MINIKLFCAQLITLKDDIAVSVKKKKKKGKNWTMMAKGYFIFTRVFLQTLSVFD